MELYEGLAFEPKKAYEVYTLKSEHVIREFDQNGTFKDNISEEYVLQVPLSNSQNELVGLTLFYQEQGGFELVAYGEMEEKQEVLTDMERVKRTCKRSGRTERAERNQRCKNSCSVSI